MLRSFKNQMSSSGNEHPLPTSSIPSFHHLQHNTAPNLIPSQLLQPLEAIQNDNMPISSQFSPSFYKFSPLDYSSNSYNPESELASIIDPTAKTTERIRLWWTSNFKKEGWKQILNKPCKPANVPRSIWQIIAFNQFMELTSLSQQAIANFSKDSLSQDCYNEPSEVIVTVRSLYLPDNSQNRKYNNNLLFMSWHEWFMAWQFYADMVLMLYPHRAIELQGYIRILSDFLRDFHFHAVMSFDRDRRLRLVEQRNTTLLHREPSIEGKHFTAAAARLQYVHKQIPYYNNKYSYPSSSYTRPIFHEGTPICKEFNRHNGCKRDNCNFQHICFICKLKSHGESSCIRNKSNRNNSTNPKPPDTRTQQ